MRTTISLDDDVLQRARAMAKKRNAPFRTVVNEALRAGLKTMEAPTRTRPYRTDAHAMGLRPGFDLDNIQELLAQVEGEGYR